MRQILQTYRSGELWLADVPIPACREGGIVVRSHHSLVSAGTERMVVELARKSLVEKARARPDLVRKVVQRVRTEGLRSTAQKVKARLDQPFTMGYSACGVVVEVGSGVAAFEPGDRVAVAGAGYATHAEYNWVPANLGARVPAGVSDADAAFATVGAIALQGVRQARPELGERVVVVGLGLVGLLTVQILKANGCAVLGVDPDAARVALALELGADDAVAGEGLEACSAFTRGRGADAVIVTAATESNRPVECAAEMSRAKGRIVIVGVVGMELPREPFYRKELDLRLSMSYGPGRYDPAYEEGGRDYPFAYVRFTEQRNLESFLYLVDQGRVTPGRLVTHRYRFEDALEAYRATTAAPGGAGTAPARPLGILLDYPQGEAHVLQRRVEVLGEGRVRPAATAAEGTLGLGFVGAGSFANAVLLPTLKRVAGVRLAGVCSASGVSARSAADRHGFDFVTTEVDELLASPGVAAVVVATPHASHARIACAALEAGKSVFVEKPLCLSEEELSAYESVLRSTRSRGLETCLTVGFNRRFSPHAVALRESFVERRTPLVVSYRVNAGRVPPEHWVQDPEVGGGRILGEVCHFVDLCGFLVGSRPSEVWAVSIGSDRRDVVAHDSVLLTIRYADGSLASIAYVAEGSAKMPKERCEVFGDGRCAALEDFRTTRSFGAGPALHGRQRKGYREELEAFVRVVREGGDWPIPWSELVGTQRVCLAALRSLATGAPVSVEVA